MGQEGKKHVYLGEFSLFVYHNVCHQKPIEFVFCSQHNNDKATRKKKSPATDENIMHCNKESDTLQQD